MKPYYYVYRVHGGLPRYKHETLESAVKESERLIAMSPTESFEILQCVAITSASKPVANTFYMDGINTRDPQLPDGLPPLPPVPAGYSKWVYRGIAWEKDECMTAYCWVNEEDDDWTINDFAGGSLDLHYIEAV